MNYANDHTWHKTLLASMAQRMRPACFIELGLGSEPAINGVVPYCTNAYGVDRNIHHGTYPGAIILNMSTDDFFREYSAQIPPPELVFIDADHRSEQVLRDLHNVAAIAAENCVVVLHDTFPENEKELDDEYCSDSWKVPKSLIWEHVTLPFPPGVTICRLHPRNLF